MLIKKIIKTFRSQGLLGLFKAVIKRLIYRLERFKLRFFDYYKLKQQGFAVNFLHEGNVVLQLPKVSFGEALFSWCGDAQRNSEYFRRSYAEVLLRNTVYELYQNGYISTDKSIIDIGCWIGDNSVVWAKYLSGEGCVFAIDPSSENLAYCKKVAAINKVHNIKLIEAVCSEKSAEKLDFDGDLTHAIFKKTDADRYLLSTTLDQIVGNEKGVVIGFLHIDVEGFEFAVLKGARELILRDSPVIAFEQHISREDVSVICTFLKDFGYRIFMVNEVLAHCFLDCRNLLAFPSSKNMPNFVDFDQQKGIDLGIYSAVVGPSLIEI